MDKERTIKKVVEKVERASTTFEKANTELKRKYLKWNIEVFNIISELAMGLISLISAMLIVILYPFIIIGEVLDRMDNK